MLIEDSVDKVHGGSNLVEQAGVTMEDVVASKPCVTGILGKITAVRVEQGVGMAGVSQAIVQMDETTQQHAAMVEPTATAAASMQQQAARLARAVSVFKLHLVGATADPILQCMPVPALPGKALSAI